MNPAAWIAIVGLIFALIVQAVGLVIWGARLTQRVKTLEEEVEPLKQLPIQFARMEVKLDGLSELVKDMNASMRWLRHPAEYEPSDLKRPGGR
jgi:hypothetical protein